MRDPSDPTSPGIGLNRYAYAAKNPIGYSLVIREYDLDYQQQKPPSTRRSTPVQ